MLVAEALSGIVTGFLVSPTNVVVDKSVMQYANKAESSIWVAAAKTFKSMFVSPLKFVMAFEFRWQCFVYFPTYTIGNWADHFDYAPDVPRPIQKLLAIFLANTTTSLIRDRIYAIRLNPHKKMEPFPATSLSLFFLRDIIAMASAFTLPPILGKAISQKFDIEFKNGERIAQIICPLMVQVVATPTHLLALGLYNNKTLTLDEQFKVIRGIYLNTLTLRCLRFLPAFGLGGICNIELRKWTKSQIPFE